MCDSTVHAVAHCLLTRQVARHLVLIQLHAKSVNSFLASHNCFAGGTVTHRCVCVVCGVCVLCVCVCVFGDLNEMFYFLRLN